MGPERKYTFENFSIILKIQIEFARFYLVASHLRNSASHETTNHQRGRSLSLPGGRRQRLINIIDGLPTYSKSSARRVRYPVSNGIGTHPVTGWMSGWMETRKNLNEVFHLHSNILS